MHIYAYAYNHLIFIPDISKNEIISTLSNLKQYAAQSKFENFTCEMLSLIKKFEKLIYNDPKEMVQNTMDKYLVLIFIFLRMNFIRR